MNPPMRFPSWLETCVSNLPGDAKAKAVAHVLRSIPIKIQAQDRIGNKRYRSILIVDSPRRLVDAFSKYVVEPALDDVRGLFGLTPQKTLDEKDSEQGLGASGA